MPDNSEDRIWIPYSVFGCLIVLSGLVYLLLYKQNVMGKLSDENMEIQDKRPEEPFKRLILFFVAIFSLFFAGQSIEIAFNAQIYTFARCNNYTKLEASQINSLYWLSEAVSRLAGIFLARIFKPPTYLALAIIIVSTGIVTLYFNFVWLSVMAIGIGVAVYFPCGVSYASMWTNMSGKYIGIFGVALTSGAMITPLANSYLMESDWTYFMHTMCFMQAIFVISFLLILPIGKKVKKSDKKFIYTAASK